MDCGLAICLRAPSAVEQVGCDLLRAGVILVQYQYGYRREMYIGIRTRTRCRDVRGTIVLPLAFDREHVSWFWGKQIDTNRYKNTYEKTTRFSYKRTFPFVPGTAVYRAMCTVRLLIPAATVQPGWITPGHDHVQPRFSVRNVEINVFYEYSYLFSVFSTCFLRTWFVSVRWFYHRFVSICIDFVSILYRFFVDFCSWFSRSNASGNNDAAAVVELAECSPECGQ